MSSMKNYAPVRFTGVEGLALSQAGRSLDDFAGAQGFLYFQRMAVERYKWLREHPAFESEAAMSGLTPAEFDKLVDEYRLG